MTNRFLKTGIAVLMPFALVLTLLLFAPAAAFAEEAGGSDFHEENSSPAAETSFSSGDFSTSAFISFPDSTTSSGFDFSLTPPPESETLVLDTNAPLTASDSPVLNGLESLPEETSAEPCEPATSSNVNEGNSYVAEITPNAFATGDNIPVDYINNGGFRGGDTSDFELTFTELGHDVIAATQFKIPAGFTVNGFQETWSDAGITTSSGQQWEGRFDDVFIYLRAFDEADYLTRNEWVSVTFNATTPTTNGAYSFETRSWTKEPDDFGDTDFGVTAPAGTNNMAAGYKDPLVIVGTSVSSPAELAAVNPGSIFTSPISYYYYVQTADLDLTGTDLTPIGNESMFPFRGSYNGNGYVIENLTMNRMNEGYVGLFGAISSTANLLNINLENVNVTGGNLVAYSNYRIGGLVGMNQGGYILNCKVSGEVTNFYFDGNPGADRVGGLVGLSSGSTAYIAKCSSSAAVNGYHYAGGLVGTASNGAVITDSYAEGTVTGSEIPSGSQLGIGGLVGHLYNDGGGSHPLNLITRCYATGSVSGVSDIGGLVGYASNTIIMDSYATGLATGYTTAEGSGVRIGGLVGGNSHSTIYCSYATGNVSGLAAVGGLVGANSNGNIENCSASGDVSAIQGSVGGFVGWNESQSQIIHCYSTGLVYNDNLDYGNPGGLVGSNLSAATVTDSYYLETSTTTHNGIGTPKSTSEMKSISTYDGWNIASTTAYDPNNIKIWHINEGQDYPKLFWQYNNVITVKADDFSKVYGDSDPAFTAIYDNTILSGTISLNRDPGDDVGIYAIKPSGLTPPAGNEYLIHYIDGKLTIAKLNILVTADTKTKIYGNADPTFTFIASPANGSALANGQTVSLSGTLNRDAGENVGVYNITRGTMTDEANPNYAITFNNADLTINARPITVTADAKTKSFGDPDPALTYQITSGSLAFSDTFSGALDRSAGEEVGAYNILQGSLALTSNYILSYFGADLIITDKADDPPPDNPPSVDPLPGDPSPDTTIDGSSEPSTGPTAQPSGLIFSSARGSPVISVDRIISGTAADLAEAKALYQAMLEAFEQNMASMTTAEYAVAVIELAIARAAIMVMEARLSGDPAALAAAIEAYQFAQQQLAAYGSYLDGEQSAVVESLMTAIDSVIITLGG